ncbi:MAG TPA: hypothetical protein VK837_13220 [Longimicrobiales bacterium]|nr:hypothetical protein [Longimicrobiales bacterium]
MQTRAPPEAQGLIAAHPVGALAVLALASLALGLAPVLLARRLITVPHPRDERARVRPRAVTRWVVEWLLPAAVLGLIVVMSLLFYRLADRPDALSAALAVVFGLLLAAPPIGIAWAVRAYLDAGIRATDSGLFLMGSFVRWDEVTDLRRTRHGLELRTPNSALLKRRRVPALGWVLDAPTVGTLEELWRARVAGADS